MSNLLPATGWVASFKHSYGDRSYSNTMPLIGWHEDDGRVIGLVVEKGRVRSAEGFTNFEGYEEDERITATPVPAQPGWWTIERITGDDKELTGFWSPIIAFLVDRHGWTNRAVVVNNETGPLEMGDDTAFAYVPARTAEGEGPWWPNGLPPEPGNEPA